MKNDSDFWTEPQDHEPDEDFESSYEDVYGYYDDDDYDEDDDYDVALGLRKPFCIEQMQMYRPGKERHCANPQQAECPAGDPAGWALAEEMCVGDITCEPVNQSLFVNWAFTFENEVPWAERAARTPAGHRRDEALKALELHFQTTSSEIHDGEPWKVGFLERSIPVLNRKGVIKIGCTSIAPLRMGISLELSDGNPKFEYTVDSIGLRSLVEAELALINRAIHTIASERPSQFHPALDSCYPPEFLSSGGAEYFIACQTVSDATLRAFCTSRESSYDLNISDFLVQAKSYPHYNVSIEFDDHVVGWARQDYFTLTKQAAYWIELTSDDGHPSPNADVVVTLRCAPLSTELIDCFSSNQSGAAHRVSQSPGLITQETVPRACALDAVRKMDELILRFTTATIDLYEF